MDMTTSDTIQTVAAVIALLALVYAANSLSLSQRTARAQFWLALRDQFGRHDDAHRKLRPGGEWSAPGAGPKCVSEWAEVEAYMGLFEHCEMMMQEQVLDQRTFLRIYSYRVQNIVRNDVIRRAKLVERRDGWITFLELVRRAGLDQRHPELRLDDPAS